MAQTPSGVKPANHVEVPSSDVSGRRRYIHHQAPQEIARRSDIDGNAKNLFYVLLNASRFHMGGDACDWGNDALAHGTGRSARAVQNSLLRLEQAGLIAREYVDSKQKIRTSIRITWTPVDTYEQRTGANEEARRNLHSGTSDPSHSGTSDPSCIKEPDSKEQEKEHATTPHPKSCASSSDPSRDGGLRVAGFGSFEDRPEERPPADSEVNDSSEVAKLIEDASRIRGATPDGVRVLVRKHGLNVVQSATRHAIATAKETWGWVVTVSGRWVDEGIPDYAQHLQPKPHRVDPAAVESQRLAMREKAIRANADEVLADPYATEWDKAIARDQLRQATPDPATVAAKAAEPPREAPRRSRRQFPSSEAPESLAGDPRAVAEQEPPESAAEQNQAVEKAEPDPKAKAEADRRLREARAEAERQRKAVVEAREREREQKDAERKAEDERSIERMRKLLVDPRAMPGQRQLAEAILRARGLLDPAATPATDHDPAEQFEPVEVQPLERVEATQTNTQAPHVADPGEEYRPAWSPAQPDPDEEASYLAMLGRAPASIEAAELEPVAAC